MKNTSDYFIEVKSSFTDGIANKSANQISIEYSFMGLSEHLSFVSEIFNKLDLNLKGEGMEVAAGASVFACSLARLFPAINKVYALEIVSDVVTKLQPKIITATNMTGRVIPMVGDFNNIQIPDNSLDFVVGFDSLHHSNNLNQTLKEIGRILKPGGKLIYFDRAHPSHMSKAQENFLLNTEYTTEYKNKHGLDPQKPYNRGDNGEHEPRIKDWYNAYNDTGLSIDTIAIFTKRKPWAFLKILAAQIPYFIRAKIKKGRNLSAYSKLILYYVCPPLARHGKVKIFPLHVNLKTPTAPVGKWIFIASKV